MFLTPFLLLLAAVPDPDQIDKELKKIVSVFSIIESQSADPVDPSQALYTGAIPGMLRKLDPHSVFFDPGQFEQLKGMEQSTQKGFGTVVSLVPGRVIVLQTLPNTPSAKAGIMPGDEIIGINGIRLDRFAVEQLVELLTESKQQKVGLEIRRSGSARVLQFMLTPENVDVPSVDRGYIPQPGIAYVRVASFDENTGKLLKQTIDKLGGSALKGLVLDLRNNPGGVVGAALETASLFLKPGQTILAIRGRSTKKEDADVPAGAQPYTFRMAVIMNDKSASASEIVAGSLQDHDRAVIVGEPSFGKGLVQSVFPLSNGTGLALTTAFYYTPSGRSIQKHLAGGQLDEATRSTRDEALEFHTDSGRMVKGGGGIMPDRIVLPERLTRLRTVLDASGAFPTFATEYLRTHPKVDSTFRTSPSVMDDFQVALAQKSIQPSVAEWSADRAWIENRLRQEILNQAAGVAKGDEVEPLLDPQIRAALREVGGE